MVGLGQRERAGLLDAGHARKPALALLVGAEQVDRAHRQAGLHAEERAEAAVAAVDLHVHEAPGERAHPRAAVALDVVADQAELAEAPEQRPGRLRALPVLVDRRQHLLVDEAPRAQEVIPLLVGELLADEEVVGRQRLAEVLVGDGRAPCVSSRGRRCRAPCRARGARRRRASSAPGAGRPSAARATRRSRATSSRAAWPPGRGRPAGRRDARRRRGSSTRESGAGGLTSAWMWPLVDSTKRFSPPSSCVLAVGVLPRHDVVLEAGDDVAVDVDPLRGRPASRAPPGRRRASASCRAPGARSRGAGRRRGARRPGSSTGRRRPAACLPSR